MTALECVEVRQGLRLYLVFIRVSGAYSLTYGQTCKIVGRV